MQPLLPSRSRRSTSKSVNRTYEHYEDEIDLFTYWDRASVIIHLLRHIYIYFLMYHWWEGIGETLLMIYLICNFMEFTFSMFVVVSVLKGKNVHDCRYCFCYLLASIYQPLFIMTVYCTYKIRAHLYSTLLIGILANGLPIFLVLSARMLDSNYLDQILILFYIILYFLCILFVYPLFMSLKSINLKHLLFKLCLYSLQIIRILFTLFLLLNFFFRSILNVNIIVAYAYRFYLINFFEFTPIFCIWIGFYTIDFEYFASIWLVINTLRNLSICGILVFGICHLIRIILTVIILPFFNLFACILLGLYWWILLESYSVFIITDSFIFVNAANDCNKEMVKETPDMTIHNVWKSIYEYLTNINDSIDYTQRLCILHYINNLNEETLEIESEELINDMQSIIMKKPGIINQSKYVATDHSIYVWIKHMLQFLVIYMKALSPYMTNYQGVHTFRKDLLSFYDFEKCVFKFEWKHLLYILFECLGLFVIIPMFVLATIGTNFVIPILLIVMYFYDHDGSETHYSNYLLDYKLWLLIIYLGLLIVIAIMFIDEYRLIRIWFDCQPLNVTNKSSVLENVQLYHNQIHEYSMIFDMLQRFFGSLSITIMEYVGMMKIDGTIYIPNLEDSRDFYSHKHTVVCSKYLFEMEVY